MTAYARIENGVVTNVEVWENDPPSGLVPLNAHHNGRWGVGWRVHDGVPYNPAPTWDYDEATNTVTAVFDHYPEGVPAPGVVQRPDVPAEVEVVVPEGTLVT